MNDILSTTHNVLKMNENEIKNNLSKKERDLLNLMVNNKKACLDILTNAEYYEELSYDPNDQYKQYPGKEIDQLRQMDYITDFEYSSIVTSLHYFSCTKELRQWIDSFLKAVAQKLLPYVQDTTLFINKIKNLKFRNVMIAALDVESLYPNIDHEEGAKACNHYLNQRKNQCIATKLLKHLTLVILRMNTMIFGGRYFHQTKGTALETPMAVNYANCFMEHFETNLLQDYMKIFRKGPTL